MALQGVNYCLNAINFTTANEQLRIWNDGLSSFDDFRNITEGDISDMAEGFGWRNADEGRIIFGHGHTKNLKGIMHWVHDKMRCNDPVSHNNFNLAAMTKSQDRASTRKLKLDQYKATSKAAKPNKYKKKQEWPSFYQAFKKYLSTILGVVVVPLTYIIHEVAQPKFDNVYQTFTDQAVSKAPLNGAHFLANTNFWRV